MYKKTITYEDYDGNQVTGDFYFNINKAEIAEMEISVDGGLSAALEGIVKSKDNRKIMKYFKKFILAAYGKRVLDEKGNCYRFQKSEEISMEFYESPAYSELIMEFLDMKNHPNSASDFVNAVFPKELRPNA